MVLKDDMSVVILIAAAVMGIPVLIGLAVMKFVEWRRR